MKTSIFILAAGDAERHNGGNKPLLVVDGDTLLNRVGMQVRKLSSTGSEDCILVTHREDLWHPACRIFVPRERDFIAATILSTASQWTERNIILLGDVYYTDEVMQEILHEQRPLVFWGDNSDIFAIVFHMERGLGGFLDGFVEKVRESRNQFGFGKMMAIFKIIGPPKAFMRVTDMTQDFDHPQDVERFNRGQFKHPL